MILFEKIFKTVAQKFAKRCKSFRYKVFGHLLLELLVDSLALKLNFVGPDLLHDSIIKLFLARCMWGKRVNVISSASPFKVFLDMVSSACADNGNM